MSEVISLINEKGGVGKSTSSITIAQILAISGYKTLLIDLDPQMNTTKMFGLSEGIEDENYEQLFCSKMDNLEELEYYVTETEYENISILSASRELNNLIYVIYDKMKETNVELYLRHNLALLKEDKSLIKDIEDIEDEETLIQEGMKQCEFILNHFSTINHQKGNPTAKWKA